MNTNPKFKKSVPLFRLVCLIVLLSSFSTLKAIDYYWVGGASNQWNTFGNWRVGSSSGTTPSSYPSLVTDNVFFGAYSNFTSYGTSVVLTQNISIGSLSISGCTVAPNVVQSGAVVLTVGGNFALQAGGGFNIGTLNFTSNSPQTITTGSVTMNVGTVNITGNGNYTVTDQYTCSLSNLNSMYITGNGDFTCNGKFAMWIFYETGSGNLHFGGTSQFISDVMLTGGGTYNFLGNVIGGEGNFHFTKGILNTNNVDFNIGLFLDDGSALPHTLNAGTTQFILAIGGGPGCSTPVTWQFTGSGGVLNIALPGSKIFITACGGLCGNSRFLGKAGDAYDEVRFSWCGSQGINGSGMSFNKVIFDGPGTIQGTNNLVKDISFGSTGNFIGNNTFTTAVVNGDGSFSGNSTFTSLTLNGYNYSFSSGSTQSVTAAFTATVPNCTGLKEMKATGSGQAFINISTLASALSNNSKLQGIAIIGDPLNSAGSYDSGNNANIIFPPTTTKTLYWVGGSGNWNDPNHWSLLNNGVYPPVSGCVPTLLDNVIFNANSGNIGTITLSGAPAYCHDMSWLGASGSPTLSIPYTNTISIYGSVILQPSLVFNTVNIHMMSTSTESITCNGARFGDGTNSDSYIYFATAGHWLCQDNFYAQVVSVSATSTLTSNNHSMNIYRMESAGTLNIGTSLIDVTVNPYWPGLQVQCWYTNGVVNTLPGSHIQIWYGNGGYGFYSGNNQHYWDVTFLYGGNPALGTGPNNTFHHVVFNYGATITGSSANFKKLQIGTPLGGGGNSSFTPNHKMDTLICYGPFPHTFGDGSTQTITALLSFTTAPCNGKMTLNNMYATATPANFSVTPSTALNMNDAFSSNISINGGTIMAVNSIDMGNNTNVSFTAAGSKTLYWIGGSGNWNDKGHWTTVPFTGDTIYPSINGCVPTRFDDVVFLYTVSGFTATTNSVALGTGSAAECRNMSWLNAIGNPRFALPNAITIYGSIVGQASLTWWQVPVTMITAPTQTATIKSNGAVFNTSWNSFTMTGGGTRVLLDDFMHDVAPTYYSSFDIQDGRFVTNNHNATLCVVRATGNSTLSLGSSSVTANGWFTSAAGVVVNASPGNLLTITSGCCTYYNWSTTDLMVTKSTDVYQDVYFSTAGTGYLSAGGAKFRNVLFNSAGYVEGNNKFGKLTILGNGTIANNSIMDTLVLSAGRTYALQSAGTQTVTGRLYASGNNCAKIVLNSTTAGTQAKLKVNAGSVNYAFGEIKDIDATPSYTPIIYSVASSDFGNNSNFSISGAVPTVSNGISSNYFASPVTSMTLCNTQLPVRLNARTYFPNPTTVFNWSDGSHADSLVVTSAGVYSVAIVYASSGVPCTINALINITVNATSVTAVASPTAVCLGNSAALTASGANTYTWSPALFLSSATISNPVSTPTSAITYTVVGTNTVTGCYDAKTVSINVNQNPTISSLLTHSVLCFGGATGSASVTASGGTPGYTYNWTPAVGSVTNTANGLSAGNYTATVFDANSCFNTQAFTINQPNALVSAVTATTQAGCSLANGSASVSVTGGIPSYTYSWTPPSPATSFTTSVANTHSLSAGVTQMTVIDANGCTSSVFISISNPNSPVIVPTQTNVLCYGFSTGAVSASVTGGSPGYTYSWSPTVATNTNVLTNLQAGNYVLTVTDMANCSAGNAFTITQPLAALTNSAVITNSVLCFGNSTGSAFLPLAGGTPGYSVSWQNNSSSTNLAMGYSAGTYTCVATDANGCTGSPVSFTIAQPTAALSSLPTQTNVTCNGQSNGIASVNVAGGTPGYTYNWTPAISSATNTAGGLSGGNYTVAITDANGCAGVQTFVITEPMLLTASITNTTQANCNQANGSATVVATGGTAAYTYSWTTPSGSYSLLMPVTHSLSAGNNNLTVTDANGCTTQTSVLITNPNSPTISFVTAAVKCYGDHTGSVTTSVSGGTPTYSYTWSNGAGTSDLANVAAGMYTLTVVDGSHCLSVETTTVTQPSSVLSLSVTNVTPVSCFGQNTGSANALASGGTPNYTYMWQPGNSTTASLNNVLAGTYTVISTDNNGCTTQNVVTISEPDSALRISLLDVTHPVCGQRNGAVNVNVTGGTPAYSYYWSNGSQSQNLSNADDGNHILIVRDGNACADTLRFLLECHNELFIPEIFSPNGDGKNDKFEIVGIKDYPNNHVQIFNRWGSPVYSKKKYNNEWDGKPNAGDATGNSLLPSGTYYVVIEFGDEGKTKPYHGYVQLVY